MLLGVGGSRPMPREIAGSEIKTIDTSSDAMNMPSVVFDNAVHLYRSPGAGSGLAAGGCALGAAVEIDDTVASFVEQSLR